MGGYQDEGDIQVIWTVVFWVAVFFIIVSICIGIARRRRRRQMLLAQNALAAANYNRLNNPDPVNNQYGQPNYGNYQQPNYASQQNYVNYGNQSHNQIPVGRPIP